MKRGFFREKVLNKKGLTNNQWIILIVVIVLLIVFVIAFRYSSSVKKIFGGESELGTLLLYGNIGGPKGGKCSGVIKGGGCRGDGIGKTEADALASAEKNWGDNIDSLESACLNAGCTLSFGQRTDICGPLNQPKPDAGYTCTLTASPCECIS